MDVYEPQEDSYLLRDALPTDLSGKNVLEIGSGSGIISIEAAKRGANVVAVDLNPAAVKATRTAASEAGVSLVVVEGDLFESVADERFDLILCNPPYLPNDPQDPDIALDGGPNGWEFIERFLHEAANHLTNDGRVLLLFSNRTDTQQVLTLIDDAGFAQQQVARRFVGLGEELYVMELVPDAA